MDYRLEDLLDIPLLQNLQDKLNLIYSFPSAIIDNDGKILTAVAWQDICTKFHRINPQCEIECIKSDQFIIEHLKHANPAVSYQCPHGLIDNAAPIIIDGKHLGNFFTGQFFLKKPDLEYFRNQAKKYGFDEKAYIEAVEAVPIWTKEKLKQYIDFIKGFIEIIAGFGLKNLIEIETNKELKESEERNRAIILSTSDWIWEIDELGKYCYCSEKIERILGFTADEILGKSPFDLMPEAESVRVKKIFQNIVEAKGPIVDLENWNLHKDGHMVCLLTNGTPVFDETGKITGYRGADKDITESRHAELMLQESNELLSSFIRHSPIYAYIKEVTSAESRVLIASENYQEMIGIPGSKMTGKKMDELFPEEFAKKITSDDWYVASHGKVIKLDEDLNNRYYSTIKFPIEIGAKTLLAGYTIDITDRKLAEDALRESEDRYKKLVELSPDSIVVHCEGKIIFANRAALNLMGAKSLDEISGKSALDFAHSDYQDIAVQRIRKLYDDHDTEGLIQEKFIKLNGEVIDVEVTAISINYAGKLSVQVIIRDITDRKKSEEKILQQLKELQRWQEVTLGREDRNRQLKHEVNELLVLLGEKIRYPSQEGSEIQNSAETTL